MSTILDDIVRDLAYLCHIYSPLCGIRICNDSRYYRRLRCFMIILNLFYCCYSLISREAQKIRYTKYLETDILMRLNLNSWSFCNAISIYLIPKYLNRFLARYEELDDLHFFNITYFRRKMFTSKYCIRWTLLLCHLIEIVSHTRNLIKLINSQDTYWKQLRAIFTYLQTYQAYVILLIIAFILMYFSCHHRYLYATIRKTLHNIDKKSEREKMLTICSIRFIYQRMAEYILVTQVHLSPLILILMIYIAPDLIIYIPKISPYTTNFVCAMILVIILTYSLIMISWISTYHAAPYDAVYRLSFDCPEQRLQVVSIFIYLTNFY